MIQSALVANPMLARLTKAIVARVRPRRIVLFGSRARGDARPDSDYDIMVEEEQEPTNERSRAHEIEDGIPERVAIQVQITVRTPMQFERRKDDVGTIDYDIAREGIVLYTDPAVSGIADLGPATRVREKKTPPESLREWIETADADLWAVEMLTASDNIKWGIVAFHCQQAAEKYLKAALVNRHVRPVRTHNLPALLFDLTNAGYSQSGLEGGCKRLSEYSIDPRYPGLRVGAAAGRLAVDDCYRIVDQAKRWLLQR